MTDGELIRLAHLLAAPRVAADLINVDEERFGLDDFLQRVYTDDGHGDGYITLRGSREAARFMTIVGVRGGKLWNDETSSLMSTLPAGMASRAENAAVLDRLFTHEMANLQIPIWQVDPQSADSEIRKIRSSPIEQRRFALLLALVPSLYRLQTQCERYLGDRDGAVVGISLELFKRRHGHYPQTLAEFEPELLPAVPADRISGDPVRYQIVNGKPIVYSVGADRIDDGGTPPLGRDHKPDPHLAAVWDTPPATAPRGDWVLFPPSAAK